MVGLMASPDAYAARCKKLVLAAGKQDEIERSLYIHPTTWVVDYFSLGLFVVVHKAQVGSVRELCHNIDVWKVPNKWSS
jgi:hypothetical protein